MLSSILTATVVLGAIGTLHCATMCGPVALTTCRTSGGGRAAMAYFGGRFAAHVFTGAVMGYAGVRAAQWVSRSMVQQIVLGVLAAVLLARGISVLSTVMREKSDVLVRIRRKPKPSRLSAIVELLLPRRALSLGLATGAFPCGLLAAGWALAAATSSPVEGALTMAMFSILTAPGLVATMLVGLRLVRTELRAPPVLQGLLWCGLAVFLCLRLVFDHACPACR